MRGLRLCDPDGFDRDQLRLCRHGLGLAWLEVPTVAWCVAAFFTTRLSALRAFGLLGGVLSVWADSAFVTLTSGDWDSFVFGGIIAGLGRVADGVGRRCCWWKVLRRSPRVRQA